LRKGFREFIRIQKLLRTKIASFGQGESTKLTDPKTKEAVSTKQQAEFMAWTSDVNKRAAYKDYLSPPPTNDETPGTAEENSIGSPIAAPHSKKRIFPNREIVEKFFTNVCSAYQTPTYFSHKSHKT